MRFFFLVKYLIFIIIVILLLLLWSLWKQVRKKLEIITFIILKFNLQVKKKKEVTNKQKESKEEKKTKDLNFFINL